MIQCEDCDTLVEAERAAKAQRDLDEAAQSRLRASNLPSAYRTGARSITDTPVWCSMALNSAAQVGVSLTGLYLFGTAGTFKTTIACGKLAESIQAGMTGLYVLVPDLLAEIHAAYATGEGATRQQLVEACISAQCLVLDDFGKEKASDHAAGVLFSILDGRYRAKRPGWLIVTSNYSIDALIARFVTDELAEPILRRLVEMTSLIEMRRAA